MKHKSRDPDLHASPTQKILKDCLTVSVSRSIWQTKGSYQEDRDFRYSKYFTLDSAKDH
jgi:hypothetical protein